LRNPESTQILLKTGGVLAAGAFGAVPLRGWAADPRQYRALTRPPAACQIGPAASPPPSSRRNGPQAGGINRSAAAKLNYDHFRRAERHTVTRNETDRLITGNNVRRPACYAAR